VMAAAVGRQLSGRRGTVVRRSLAPCADDDPDVARPARVEPKATLRAYGALTALVAFG
jgi:hypothetical protein